MTIEIVELIVQILEDHSTNGHTITIKEACDVAYQLVPDIWLYAAMWNTRAEYQKQFARMQQLYTIRKDNSDVTPTA
ncbi:MAG: hypothetical protein HC876_23130 [Chloroflexaceae bacterium]|nr:hypothetical protein [Chloroflexaceae bacterium]